MSLLILDSSATLAWIYGDETTEAIRQVFYAIADNGAVVLTLWRFEVANSLTIAIRKRRIDPDFRRAALADLALLDITTDQQTDSHAWTDIGADMPTKYKAQLDHVGFDWTKDKELILQSLMARKDRILAKAEFNGDHAASFIEDICGILSWAAAVRMDGGFKATNKIIATLEAVEKDPSIINTGNVEPEAKGMIASQYQLADETPGTYGFDVYQDEGGARTRSSTGQSRSIAVNSSAANRSGEGRSEKILLDLLGEKLCDLFLRYNEVATRHSVASDGEVAQMEAGPYFEFCETVIASLNEFFASLPQSYEAKPISAAQVVRKRAKLRRVRR